MSHRACMQCNVAIPPCYLLLVDTLNIPASPLHFNIPFKSSTPTTRQSSPEHRHHSVVSLPDELYSTMFTSSSLRSAGVHSCNRTPTQNWSVWPWRTGYCWNLLRPGWTRPPPCCSPTGAGTSRSRCTPGTLPMHCLCVCEVQCCMPKQPDVHADAAATRALD